MVPKFISLSYKKIDLFNESTCKDHWTLTQIEKGHTFVLYGYIINFLILKARKKKKKSYENAKLFFTYSKRDGKKI